ncbi:MAG: nucleotidyltransferase domain-containing protein [Chloroflexota bacterium]
MQLSVYPDVQARYENAINALTEKLKQDRYILAAIIFGSLARGEGWAKSNVDLVIIRDDDKQAQTKQVWLTEDGVIIEARIVPRQQYKRQLERALQGTPTHSIRTLSKVLFSKDDTITAWFTGETEDVGSRDQLRQAAAIVSDLMGTYRKAEKWLIAKKDVNYSFFWILRTVNELARVEMILNGKAPAREVIHQAMDCNPTFFGAVYTDLINGPKDTARIEAALQQIDHYLIERTPILFQPILDFLASVDGPCSISDFYAHFLKWVPGGIHAYGLEWLYEKGVIEKLSAPRRLTKKSSVEMQELAYYFNEATFDWENWQPATFDVAASQARYQDAVETFARKLEKDRYIEAAFLFGSLSRGDHWGKSDVDVFIVHRDDARAKHYHWLTENGVNFDTFLFPRHDFKRSFDMALQGTFAHSVRSQCTALFCKDETLHQWMTETNEVNPRDQTLQAMKAAASVPYLLRKAEKWLVVRQDVHYCLLWTLFVVNNLANVEVILNGEAPGREVIHQALKYNPEFFNQVYTDVIEQPQDEQSMRQVLDQLITYLEERTPVIFQPILAYLEEAGEPRTASDLDQHFRKMLQDDLYGFAYEWLADKGFVDKLSAPYRLTTKSQVTVQEAAYFYDTDEPDWDF